MLATMNPSHHDLPLREHSNANVPHDSREAVGESMGLDDRLCPGCKKSAVSEQGGLVVAFGQSFFHVDCFKCAKCGDQVTADTNLLLLSDGSPICANCSYSCNVCRLPILDEAIMTGDDSYHAHCFKCKVCKSRIDELVFAKTSQGIYCMNCHNERMIKIRKHTQKKAERERAAGGSGSTKSRERDARNYHRDNGASSPAMDGRPTSSRSQGLQGSGNSRPSSSRGTDPSVRSPAKPPSGPYVSDAFESNTPTTQPHPAHKKPLPSLSSYPSSQSISVTVAPPPEPERPSSQEKEYPPRLDISSDPDRPNPAKQSTLPIPHSSVDVEPDGRRRSYDDRPLNVLFGRKGDPIQQAETPMTAPSTSDGLTVTTSRRDKRRSINPALSLSEFNSLVGAPTLSPTLSPRSSAFQTRPASVHVPTPPLSGSLESPTTPSPFREQFQTNSSSSRPSSHGSSRLSHSTPYSARSSPILPENRWNGHSRSPSPSLYPEDTEDQTIVIKQSPPSSVTLLDSAPPPRSRAKNGEYDGQPFPNAGGPQRQSRSSANLDPNGVDVLRPQRSFDDRRQLISRPNSGSQHPVSRSRSISPARRADVPQNIESEMDTEPEDNSANRSLSRESVPPAPPPKENKDAITNVASPTADGVELAISPISPVGSGSDDMSESSPVQGTSHTTFIAPAIPPIRFSVGAADFSELFSVGSIPSLKALDHLAKLSEEKFHNDPSPPTTATLGNTSNSSVTLTVQPDQHSNTEGVYDLDSFLNDDQDVTGGSDSSHTQFVLTSSSPSTNSGHETVSRSNGPNSNPNELKESMTRITLTEPESTTTTTLRHNSKDIVALRLQEALADANERGAQQLKMDKGFIEAILATLESRKSDLSQMKNKFDGIKRTSKQYIEGLTVAQTEYDRELKARRDAEAEVTRLRVLLSGQVARLTALSGDSRKEELRQQLSRELNDNLSGLEHDLSKLKVERDMTLAEVEELSATKVSPESPQVNLGRSLTKRLETIKSQYKRDLVPLTQEREKLVREITELKAVRDVFLEETTVLNARNEELAQLSTVYFRRMEGSDAMTNNGDSLRGPSLERARVQAQQSIPFPPSLSSSTSGSSTVHDDGTPSTYMKVPTQGMEQRTPSKKFGKWGSKAAKEALSPPAASDRKALMEHNFQQLSVLRFTRCDHCGDKMWGSQLRCTVCNTSIHVRCAGHVQMPCAHQGTNVRRPESPPAPLPPSMFGRDLTEQVHADSKTEERQVPVIVEKCIDAVETLALDYEGIYRKTGGSGQSKAITQLFERGDYATFDLRDSDRFNDICSVTSVLKNYFRSLPIPLLTYDLHDQFMSAVHVRDPTVRHNSLLELVNKLPNEHYYTLRMLMLHLNHVCERSERNLMNARNLGVVFGPTLMRSRDPSAEFSDMAGKALSVEWLVDNAPFIFNQNTSN